MDRNIPGPPLKPALKVDIFEKCHSLMNPLKSPPVNGISSTFGPKIGVLLKKNPISISGEGRGRSGRVWGRSVKGRKKHGKAGEGRGGSREGQ